MPKLEVTSGPPSDGAMNGGAGPLRRVSFAVIALLAGNTALLLFLLQSGLRMRAAMLKLRMGAPHLVLPEMWEIFRFYAIFSVAGWVLVGLPTALAFPPRLLVRMAWPVRLVIGAAMGPLALFLIVVVLFTIQGRPGEFTLAHTEGFWPFSILVSTVSFLVYTALLRRHCMDR